MRRLVSRGASLACLLLALPHAILAQAHEHPAGDADRLGTVEFPVSCSPAASATFGRAVAMLHSFWFDAAQRAFTEIAAADPSCAMAQWGIAVTQLGNPMTRVAPPAPALEQGRAAARQAQELAARASPREQQYVAAVVAYYEAPEGTGHVARMQAVERALEALYKAQPADHEAAIFYARTLVANAPPGDHAFALQHRAAEIMEPLFAQHPDHPGLAHYLIHAYDAPQLAAKGKAAALAYAGIAPAAPHALHMPSHIFTRLGYWDESIETNIRSARAEPDSNAAVHPMDYLVYAYLQQGRDRDAHGVVQRAVQNDDRYYGGLLGYNFAAMPARYALERGDWAAAAALKVPVGALPYVEAVTRFARGIGAARSGEAAAAEAEAAALAALHAKLLETDRDWATRVEAQRLAVAAWIAHAKGSDDDALRLAQEASALEETVEKHPVTPGPILPARELEGDLLLELGRAADAQAAYEQTLVREPGRARTLFGAARAAERAGEAAAAARHYDALLAVMAKGEATRPELVAARAFRPR